MSNSYVTDLPARLAVLKRVHHSAEWRAMIAALADRIPVIQSLVNDFDTIGEALQVCRARLQVIQKVVDGSLIAELIRETEGEILKIERAEKERIEKFEREERNKGKLPPAI